MMLMSEYILATGDKSLLPGLRRIALDVATGARWVGSWGHSYAGGDGRLIGYGMMNSTGVPLTIGLVLDLDRAQTALARLAALDALTGVFNRGHFMERLEAEAGRHFRTGDPLTLLMLDADHFKAINDTFGHSTGDQALIAIAQTASAALREGDVFARYGGEEFVALLPSTTRSEGIELAERVRTSIAALSVTSNDGRPVPVTVSIGVSVLTSPAPECRRLFDSADGALYEAKRGGRNRCVVAERSARAA
jgi:diguanylate cyclase (GGDEF)-like protein